MKPTNLTFLDGNIFRSECDAFVCPIYCDGGITTSLQREFDNNFPDYVDDYQKRCVPVRPGSAAELIIGQLLLYKLPIKRGNLQYIISFPIKNKYDDSVQAWCISLALPNLALLLKKENIVSVAIPALGANQKNKLKWRQVKEIFMQWEEAYRDLLLGKKIEIYVPLKTERAVSSGQ